jgi:hypothetical protein
MASLTDEGRYFHTCLFGRPPDDMTIRRYEAAHRELFASASEPPWIGRIVERRLDAEAIEFALRRRGLGSELTRKFQILCYLAESRAVYLPQFVNFHPSRSRAWSALSAVTFGAAWKLCKGEFAIRRHGLL